MYAHEFALLVVAIVPVAVVAALNFLLAASGESGTLLLPAPGRWPAISLGGPGVTPRTEVAADVAEAANDQFERRAA